MSYKPRLANPEEVTIERHGDTAVIEFNDSESGAIHLKIGQEIGTMSDRDILQLHNEIVLSQLELSANWRPTEIAPGWDPLESTCRHASLSIL